MIETHRYREHEVRIELIAIASRQFRWRWTIDGIHVSRSGAVLPSEEQARSEALLYAQVMIARLTNDAKVEAA